MDSLAPASPATFTAAIRAPDALRRFAAAGTYRHRYVHAVTSPPSDAARENGTSRVMDANVGSASSAHDSSRTIGDGSPAETTTTSRLDGSCAPRSASSNPAPSSASAKGAAAVRRILSPSLSPSLAPQHASGSRRRFSTRSRHSRGVYLASGIASLGTRRTDDARALFGAGYNTTAARDCEPSCDAQYKLCNASIVLPRNASGPIASDASTTNTTSRSSGRRHAGAAPHAFGGSPRDASSKYPSDRRRARRARRLSPSPAESHARVVFAPSAAMTSAAGGNGRGWPPGRRGWRGARRRRRGKDDDGYEILEGISRRPSSPSAPSSTSSTSSRSTTHSTSTSRVAPATRCATRATPNTSPSRADGGNARERSVDRHARPRGKRKPRGERRRARVAPRHAHATRPVGAYTIHANPRAPVAVSRRE